MELEAKIEFEYQREEFRVECGVHRRTEVCKDDRRDAG